MTRSNSGRMMALLTVACVALAGCQAAPALPGPAASATTREVQPQPGNGAGSSFVASAGAPAVASACPQPPIELGDLLLMDPTARLTCMGDQPITLVAYIPWQEHVCGDTGIEPSWLGACSEVVDLTDEASDFAASLATRVHPSTGLQANSLPQRLWVLVTGHFDDPAALDCWQTPAHGAVAAPVAATILECRRQFVLTELQEALTP